MKVVATDVLLGLTVLSAWLGCAGLLRLRTALERLHCVAFVNAASGFFVTVAVFVQDGLSDRALKTLLILLIVLLVGAAATHAAARALLLRGGTPR